MAAISVKEVLVRARARIDTPEKWGKGYEACGLTPGCMTECVGIALDRAAASTFSYSEDPGWNLAREMFRDAAGLSDDAGSIIDWNDDPDRTHVEVMAVFDKAILLSEKQSEID